MSSSRCRLAILIASLVAWFHLMPGAHSLFHDRHDAIEHTEHPSLSAETPACTACALLAGHRDKAVSGPAMAVCTDPSRPAHVTPGPAPEITARVLSSTSPRAPPAA